MKSRSLYVGKWSGLSAKTIAKLARRPYHQVRKALSTIQPSTLEEVGDLISKLRSEESPLYLDLIL